MGTGTIATEHMVAAIRSIGHEARWVVSRNKEYAKFFSEDLKIPQTSTEASQALNDPLVDFAYVSAARDRRKHYISAAADARKHILCDAPISHSSRIAGGLVEQCRAAGVALAVNQPSRASIVHQTMRRLSIEGHIGTLQSLLIVRGAPYHSPPNRRSEELPSQGELLLDVSVEDVDLARFLTGQEPIEVSALSAAPNVASKQQISYAMRLSGGAMFQAFESYTTAEIESLVMLAGDQGALIAQGTLNGKAGTLTRRANARNELVPVRERDLPATTIEGFLASTRTTCDWLCRGDDNVIALRAAEAIKASNKRQRTVPVQSK
ncbi:Gfo/Idh/MocA family oxidoreductase (plasmid) [Ensifer adhaerens]|nr:Gfo/Idh/MocA family oxidoreductase [Ensifer adhaerens]WDZ81839.1 Gfo/Idh/MocA family oxidoreductase [Ensifer adhaerens]